MIDLNIIKKWNKNRALKKLYTFFTGKKNKESISAYRYTDELDVSEIIYYILAYSKGYRKPTNKEIKELSNALMQTRLDGNIHQFTDFYCVCNGEMTDMHLYYFLEKLFSKFSTELRHNYGFDHSAFILINFFYGWNKSFIFTKEKLEKFICKSGLNEDDSRMLLSFIDFYTICENDLCLNDMCTFQKTISKKPFIKLNSGKYVFFYHWFRTHVLANFHYLLHENEAYKKHKGDLFEEIPLSIFKGEPRVDKLYSNLKYRGGEVDILVETEDLILIIECKSTLLYDDYKRGYFDEKVKRNINSFSGKASQQLKDIEKHILKGGSFRNKIDGKNVTIEYSNKEIILLNICFEFPFGMVNKSEDIISIALVDFMILIDQLRKPISPNPNVDNIFDYLRIRKKALYMEIDDELSIMSILLYFKHLDIFLKHKKLDMLIMDTKEYNVQINKIYGELLKAKIFPDTIEYKEMKEWYNGVLWDFIFL